MPDTAGRGVPAPLFADRLLGVIHWIFNPKNEAGFAGAIRFHRVREIELKRRVAVLVVAEMFAVTPAISEEISGADGQDDPLAVPVRVVRNVNRPAVPSDFVARRRAMIGASNFERIEKDAGGIIIFVSGGIAFAPGRE